MLFDSTTLGTLPVENRVGLAPMTRVSARADGRATREMADYYARFADGGFSVLITEGVYTDDAYSQGYLNQPGLVTDDHVAAWSQVTEAVHDAGAPVVAQLMHGGAQTQGNPHVDGDVTLAPSAVGPEAQKAEAYGGSGEFPEPRRATREDLDAVREGFVDAATNAQEAGFDGVEIHAANGYLLNEFLAADMNQRDDEYGGGPDARVRYPESVISAVDDAVREDFVVGVRVSQGRVTNEEYEWPEGESAAAVFFEALSAAGADYVHTTEGDATSPTFGEDGPTLAEAASEHVTEGTTVVANGGLGDPDAARTAVENGANLVTLATSALANPDWPTRVRNDESLTAFDPAEFLVPTATIGDHELPDAASADD